VQINDVTCLNFCVALGKAGTFSSSPRAEFLSFDFHYDVYPKATVSDKKERVSPGVGVRCSRAHRSFLLPAKLGESKAPIDRCLAPIPPSLPQVLCVAKHWPVLVAHVPASFVEKDDTLEGSLSCSELGVHSVPR